MAGPYGSLTLVNVARVGVRSASQTIPNTNCAQSTVAEVVVEGEPVSMDDPTLVDYLRFWDATVFFGVPLSLLVLVLVQRYRSR